MNERDGRRLVVSFSSNRTSNGERYIRHLNEDNRRPPQDQKLFSGQGNLLRSSVMVPPRNNRRQSSELHIHQKHQGKGSSSSSRRSENSTEREHSQAYSRTRGSSSDSKFDRDQRHSRKRKAPSPLEKTSNKTAPKSHQQHPERFSTNHKNARTPANRNKYSPTTSTSSKTSKKPKQDLNETQTRRSTLSSQTSQSKKGKSVSKTFREKNKMKGPREELTSRSKNSSSYTERESLFSSSKAIAISSLPIQHLQVPETVSEKNKLGSRGKFLTTGSKDSLAAKKKLYSSSATSNQVENQASVAMQTSSLLTQQANETNKEKQMDEQLVELLETSPQNWETSAASGVSSTSGTDFPCEKTSQNPLDPSTTKKCLASSKHRTALEGDTVDANLNKQVFLIDAQPSTRIKEKNQSIPYRESRKSTDRKRPSSMCGTENAEQRQVNSVDMPSPKRPRYDTTTAATNHHETSRRNAAKQSMRHESRAAANRETRERKGDYNSNNVCREVQRKVDTTSDNAYEPIRYKALEAICLTENKDEAMLEIIRMEGRYIALLNSKDEIREDLLKLVIDSLVIAVQSTNRKTQVITILRKTYQQLLRVHLHDFILNLTVKNNEDLEALITKLINIFEAILQRIGNMVTNALPMLELNSAVETFHKGGHVKDHIKVRLEKTNALWEDVRKRANNKGPNGEDLEPPNDYRQMSVVPDYMDFQPGIKPFLRANVIDNAYNNVQHYLDVQFRLLREDFIIPLRDGVKQLRRDRHMLENGTHAHENAKKNRQAFVYHDVEIVNPVCNRNGDVYRIHINTRHHTLRSVKWEKSKRLKFGALVCLSPDNFDTLYFAAVENRDSNNLEYGELELRFYNCERQVMRGFIEEKTRFEMVESDSYFEAYKHNLSVLQQLNEDNLPFKEYIVHCNKEILPPKYLIPEDVEKEEQTKTEENGGVDLKESNEEKPDTSDSLSEGELPQQFKYMNLKSITDPELVQDSEVSNVPVLDLNQWPSKEALGLDDSQYRACQLALTNRFALIQGPPGTGKTYVGLKIAQVLLDNQELWSGEDKSPILMVSYTNHALDQFLMGLKDRRGIVRIGGRSREKELENNNLKMLRRQPENQSERTRERGRIWRNIKGIEEQYRPKEASRLIADSNKAVLSVGILETFIDYKHLNFLRGQSSYEDSVLLKWLGVKTKDKTERKRNEFSHNDNFQRMFTLRQYDEDDFEPHQDEHQEQRSVIACHLNDVVKPAELRRNLEKYDRMSVEKERSIHYLYNIKYHERWDLYRLWRDRLQRDCQQKLHDTQDAEYELELNKLHDIDKEKDLKILREARVVGMTTTSAAKYRDLLQRVRPKIILVEEAAEVLEAHILTSLPLDCDHVILIGDHQQLRPSCTVYELSRKYKLNISMFERLVNLDMPCVRLSEQHRMRPEIASLMKHIYKDLHNHTSVNEYDNVKGFQHNIFFVDHRYPEGDSEDSHSHFNDHEAKFLVNLCRYIIQQGYEPCQVTILTSYLGQMFTIRDHMTSDGEDLKQIRLTTIDNYQGEENDIILLSLVRSNDTGHVGFINDINRACVALSRARLGLYVIGNFELLSAKSDIWKKVVGDLKENKQIGEALPLQCQSHSDVILVKEPKDFQEMVPCGGCRLPCQYRLDRCGHACTLPCHPYDIEHNNFRCIEQCTRTIIGCENGHPCQRKCWEYCESKCSYPVDKKLSCGHVKKNARCSDKPCGIKCDQRCEKYLKCGHQCQARCGEPCTSACQELVKHNDWPCGHEVTIACSATPLNCRAPCSVLSCGHNCSGKCGECLQGRVHKRCMRKCGRTLVCTHQCRASCTITCPPCTEKCQTACTHSECPKTCGELCRPCTHQCEWKCEHLSCNMKCGEVCDRARCNEPCPKKLTCGHKCRGLCKEYCICVICEKDEIPEIFGTEDFDKEAVRFIQLKDCKHIFEVSGLDHWIDMDKSEPGENAEIQMKTCPSCKTPIRKTMRYNVVIKKQLEDIEKVKGVILGDQQTLQARKMLPKVILNQYIGDVGTNTTRTKHLRNHEILEKRIEQSKYNFQLTSLENQVKLLKRCHKVMEKLKMTKNESPDQTSADRTEILSIFSTLNYLNEKRIVGCDVERELKDIDLEITRQSLRLEVCCLLKDTKALDLELKPEHKEQVDDITRKLTQVSRIEEPELESYLKEIEEVRSKYPGISPPTPEERDQIVKAMGLAKGHWFKCRQGHVYAIGECGGAMERGTCPECKDVIGGASHRLEEGNTVAAEMDGAQFAAWSEQANMANYEL